MVFCVSHYSHLSDREENIKDPLDTLTEQALALGTLPMPHHATESTVLGNKSKNKNYDDESNNDSLESRITCLKSKLVTTSEKKTHSTFFSPQMFIMFPMTTSKILRMYSKSPQETDSYILAAVLA